MTEYNEIRNLKKRVDQLAKLIKENSSAPRASYTAIHDGGISEYDADGNLVSRTGVQHDGTHGAADLFGPIPPVPTDPVLAGAPVSLTITWDGHVIDEQGDPRPLPLDFQCVQIFAWLDGETMPAEPRGVITSEQGGDKSLTVAHGTWHVALRTRAKSGRMSAMTTTVSVEVPNTVDVGAIEAEIAQAQADAAAALSVAEGAQTSADGKNTVHYAPTAPAGTDHVVGDTWFDTSADNRISRWDGTDWVLAELGTDALEDLAVTNAKIGNLDAAKVTAGVLDAQRIGAKSISTEKLLIGSTDNLVDDPDFATLGTTNSVWGATSSAIIADATGGRAGGTSLKIALDGVEHRVTSADQWKNSQPEAVYRLSSWVKSSVALPAGSITSFIEQTSVESSLALTGGSTSYASTPSSADLNIVGDIDIRARWALDDWTPSTMQTLVSKWVESGNQRSYALNVTSSGELRLYWSASGSSALSQTSTESVPVADSAVLWVRAALDVENGEGGYTVRFYTSSDGQNWEQLGTDLTSAFTTSIFAGTADLVVGADGVGGSARAVGKVYRVEVRDGLDNNVVAGPDFSVLTAGTTSFSSDNAVWSIQSGASIPVGVLATSEISAAENLDGIPENTWTFVSELAAPASVRAISVRPVIRVSPDAGSSGNIWFDQVALTRAATGNLIVDGSIVASKLAAESVSTEQLVAGSVTGETLAGEIILGSNIKTSETGQRVEMDANGIRLISADEEVRVSIPSAAGEPARFRGEVEADRLMVIQGSQFSATNEFTRSSVITLEEQVSGPALGPAPTMVWEGVTLSRPSMTGNLGTFSLNPAMVAAIGKDYRTGGGFCVVQRRGSGSRVWYYNMDGTLQASDPFDDYVGREITGFSMTADNHSVYLSREMGEGPRAWSIFNGDVSITKRTDYNPADIDYTPYFAYTGSEMILAEKRTSGAGLRLRRLGMPSGGGGTYTLIENVNPTGIGPMSSEIAFVYRGSADFGSVRWLVSYQGTGSIRAYYPSGTPRFDEESFDPPASKVGAMWDPDTGRFYTLGADGVLYKHTDMAWTSSADDTWHVGQSFRDSNVSGGEHETALGTISSFKMEKRAGVRLTLADIPGTGGVDEPNEWRLYAKRGTAPNVDRTDMWLQASGSGVGTYTMTAPPVTSGTNPLTVGTFDAGTPAVFRSARALPLDSSKPVIELKGSGSGRFGPLEVSSAGTLTDTRNLTGTFTPSGMTDREVQIWVRGSLAGMEFRARRGTASHDSGLGSLPSAYRPTRLVTVPLVANTGGVTAFLIIDTAGVVTYYQYGSTASDTILRGGKAWPTTV